MNIFKEFHYREVTETLREIMDGPYKGYALSNKGVLYDKNNRIVPLNSTTHHPTRYISQEGYTITLWRLMCYIWLDDLTDFEADIIEQGYIYNYQLTKKFISIFLVVLVMMNLLYLFASGKFVFEFVKNKSESTMNTLVFEENEKISNPLLKRKNFIYPFKMANESVDEKKSNEEYLSERSSIEQALIKNDVNPWYKKIINKIISLFK